MKKVNQLVICKEDYNSIEEFKNAVRDTIMLLLDANYETTVRYDEKSFGMDQGRVFRLENRRGRLVLFLCRCNSCNSVDQERYRAWDHRSCHRDFLYIAGWER